MYGIMLLQIRNRHVKDDKKQQVHVTMYLTAQESISFLTNECLHRQTKIIEEGIGYDFTTFREIKHWS